MAIQAVVVSCPAWLHHAITPKGRATTMLTTPYSQTKGKPPEAFLAHRFQMACRVAPAMTRRKAFVFIRAGDKGFPGILAENCHQGVARLSWFPAGG